MTVHPHALHPLQAPYPFMTIPSYPVVQNTPKSLPLQSTDTEGAAMQGTSTRVCDKQNNAAHSSFIQSEPVQSISTKDKEIVEPILRNSSGQRVDPLVGALGWLVREACPQNLCYEYHLLGQCTQVTTPCHRSHTGAKLDIHQLNALQVLAKEVPCKKGNSCSDWRCCFGHRCPFGARCKWGGRCRFSPETHVTDLKIANNKRL